MEGEASRWQQRVDSDHLEACLVIEGSEEGSGLRRRWR